MKLYPKIHIISKDELLIVKSASAKWREIFFMIILIALPVALYFFLGNGQNPHWPHDTKGIAFSMLFFLVLVTNYFFMIRRTLRSCHDFRVVLKDGGIWIDRRIFSENAESAHVFIQLVGGSNGIGITYTIGLRSGKRIESLAYGLSEEKSEQLSQELSSFLSLKLIMQENKIFALYQGY